MVQADVVLKKSPHPNPLSSTRSFCRISRVNQLSGNVSLDCRSYQLKVSTENDGAEFCKSDNRQVDDLWSVDHAANSSVRASGETRCRHKESGRE